MNDLNDILNLIGLIGDFHFCSGEKEIALTGALTKRNGNIILEARTAQENLEYINQNDTFQIWGTINATQVTLLENLISVYFVFDSGSDYGNISAEPTEIIVGRCYHGEINVTGISATMESLNYMFSEKLFKDNMQLSKENPSVLDYTFPQGIKAKDAEGEICISRGFQCSWSYNRIEYKILPNIEYVFSKPIEIKAAIAKIAAVRNLLSFFADYYLPLENLTFSDKETTEAEGVSRLYDCTLYMNNVEEINIPQRPFLLMTSKFSENFPTIWSNWLQFYNDSIYIPTLFYEIISNRSTRINRFLNLTQAVELYSNYYRNDEALSIARRDGYKKGNVPLRYRIEEILTYLGDCLEISPEIKVPLSKSISDARNFFTHYNKEKYAEPTFQQVQAANRLLRYMLLSIVYKSIGIGSNDIRECKERFEYRILNRDVRVILKEK